MSSFSIGHEPYPVYSSKERVQPFYCLNHSSLMGYEDTQDAVALAEKIMEYSVETFSKVPTTQIYLIYDEDIPSAAISTPLDNVVEWNLEYMEKCSCSLDLQVFWLIVEKMNIISFKKIEEVNSLAFDGKYNKEKYVEEIERIEHKNACIAQELIVRAAENKVFQCKQTSFVPKSFTTYHLLQQFRGHTERISAAYDEIFRTQNRPTIPYRRSFPFLSKDIDINLVETVEFLFECRRRLEEANSLEQKSLAMYLVSGVLESFEDSSKEVQEAVKVIFPDAL